ncbi:MAG: TIM barrel protein [Bacteroidetes bacterium]|nr:TIM barrel protein [Bacteroidota bacterium]MDA1119656.1 TIM barrel protein [Bacteroidota bacterium]
MKSRRQFIKASGLTAVGAMAATWDSKASETPIAAGNLNLALASYTLRGFDLEQTLAMTNRVGLKNICIKSMHLAMDSSVDEINAVAEKVKAAGINLYGVGVVYMKTEGEVDQAFEYAKNAGMSVIVGVPNPELLGYTAKKAKLYGIRVAIHNHGPGDDLYPGPGDVYKKIKDLDLRMGLCVDIGHTFRIGLDPIVECEKYFDRIYDIHLKDIDYAKASGKSVEIGRGAMDIPGFLQFLTKKRFNSMVSIEYEKDGDDPLPGLAESVGYINGVLDTLTI